jgi:abequosyltransferase
VLLEKSVNLNNSFISSIIQKGCKMLNNAKNQSNLFLSICIPSYNRPIQLRRLLDSIQIDNYISDYEIIIAEDYSPNRELIVSTVDSFRIKFKNKIRLILNETNLGYDSNLRNLIRESLGDYVIFMGDDDVFVEDKIDGFLIFLKQNQNLSYVLTSHLVLSDTNEKYSIHRYFKGNHFFEPSVNSVVTLFRKSVFISGFTFNRKLFNDFNNNSLDGTLLFQLYILAVLISRHSSAYYDDTIIARYRDNVPYFGSSEVEKDLYVPGEVSVKNSVNFMKSYIKLLDYLKESVNLDIKKEILLDMSKYSYPILSIQRKRGVKEFIYYSMQLKSLGYGKSFFFYLYFVSLLLLGEKICDFVIDYLKNRLNVTPKL